MGPRPDPEPTTPIAGWVSQGKPLKMDPASFRGYGKNIATLRGNLENDTLVASTSLQGGGKDISMSTGGFPPGTQMQQLCSRNAGEMAAFLPDMGQNIAAISSVALIMAEVFAGMDGSNAAMLNAVQWALCMPGATKPDGLPAGLDPKQTIESLMQKKGEIRADPHEDQLISTFTYTGVVIEVYRTGDGGTRSVTRTPEGRTETLTDKDGKTVYTTTVQPDGQTTTTSYVNGKRAGKTITSTTTEKHGANVSDEVTTTTRYDAEDTKLSVSHDHVKTTSFPDGTHIRDYYTVDEKGNRTNERHIGAQGDPVTGEDWEKLAQQRMDRLRRTTGGM
ncbi:hypothetical protein [Amycolatopsis granulosa]|uniref:hypothetical protein n=1 Tax=Amycolatopsis granulosa TaxID=185684 RepID=UPI001420549F|nr:hypothetical protein [Amycolatopsis granulosa]NIH84499.1 hypothetical protein [Amycolatopsis granulosa]